MFYANMWTLADTQTYKEPLSSFAAFSTPIRDHPSQSLKQPSLYDESTLLARYARPLDHSQTLVCVIYIILFCCM